MKQEFHNNVQQLFHTIVTDTNNAGNAHDLLNTLLCKVTLPLRHYWEDDHLKLVYYNVSLDISTDLTSMSVSYNSDFATTLHDLHGYNTFQLAEFVLALERDIPQWRHIWLAADELRRKKAKMAERIKTHLRVLHHCLLRETNLDDEKEQNYRISFYNIKAAQLMLANDNPCWDNQHTEADILAQCHIYHIDTPIEQWYNEWTHFNASCQAERSERERKIQERYDRLMKMRHLINLKQLKVQAYLNTIQFHETFSAHIDHHFDLRRLDTIKYSSFHLHLSLAELRYTFMVKYSAIDKCIKKIIEYIKLINDKVPYLNSPYKADSTDISSDATLRCINRICYDMELYIKKIQHGGI